MTVLTPLKSTPRAWQKGGTQKSRHSPHKNGSRHTPHAISARPTGLQLARQRSRATRAAAPHTCRPHGCAGGGGVDSCGGAARHELRADEDPHLTRAELFDNMVALLLRALGVHDVDVEVVVDELVEELQW